MNRSIRNLSQSILVAILILAGLTLLLLPQEPVSGQGLYPTPTAQEDGRILYFIQTGDTCAGISYKFAMNEDTLRSLNNLQGDDCLYLQPGNPLLLGIYVPEVPTNTPAAPTDVTPTPIPAPGTICVFLFEDVNGNTIAEDDEAPIEGGAISVTDRFGLVSLTGSTIFNKNWDPVCFENLTTGEYNIGLAVPDGYNATTSLNRTLTLHPGETDTVDFGAQLSSAASITEETTTRRPIFAAAGLALLLGGIGLEVYLRVKRIKR